MSPLLSRSLLGSPNRGEDGLVRLSLQLSLAIRIASVQSLGGDLDRAFSQFQDLSEVLRSCVLRSRYLSGCMVDVQTAVLQVVEPFPEAAQSFDLLRRPTSA